MHITYLPPCSIFDSADFIVQIINNSPCIFSRQNNWVHNALNSPLSFLNSFSPREKENLNGVLLCRVCLAEETLWDGPWEFGEVVMLEWEGMDRVLERRRHSPCSTYTPVSQPLQHLVSLGRVPLGKWFYSKHSASWIQRIKFQSLYAGTPN